MEQQHYFPPLHGAVDCEKCEVRDCWCRGKFQRNRRNMPHTSGRCPRLPDLCGFVEKEERELYKATFMLVHAEYGVGGLHLTLTIPGHKRNRKVYQTKSGYWYCNLTSEKGCPERQVLNLESYQSKEDILRKEALQLHIDRVFDNPQWGGYLPFNKRYRPEVWRAAHIVYVRNECCHKISPVTQEQIDHAYNGTIPCPHCGRWSEFIVLGIRLQPEPLVPCLNCDCHDPDMGCTMPSIDKSYACPLVSCDDEQTEVLDE